MRFHSSEACMSVLVYEIDKGEQFQNVVGSYNLIKTLFF
jgi:hypothetical protein